MFSSLKRAFLWNPSSPCGNQAWLSSSAVLRSPPLPLSSFSSAFFSSAFSFSSSYSSFSSSSSLPPAPLIFLRPYTPPSTPIPPFTPTPPPPPTTPPPPCSCVFLLFSLEHAGDFNSIPGSEVYNYMLCRHLQEEKPNVQHNLSLLSAFNFYGGKVRCNFRRYSTIYIYIYIY